LSIIKLGHYEITGGAIVAVIVW